MEEIEEIDYSEEAKFDLFESVRKERLAALYTLSNSTFL